MAANGCRAPPDVPQTARRCILELDDVLQALPENTGAARSLHGRCSKSSQSLARVTTSDSPRVLPATVDGFAARHAGRA